MGFEMIAVDDDELVYNLNYPSMAWLYEVMRRADALSEEQVAPPDVPEGWDDDALERVATYVDATRDLVMHLAEVGFDVTEDMRALLVALRAAVSDAPDDAQLDAYEAYEARREAIVTQPGKDPKRVPAFKFESQDGWLVSPDECRALAGALKKALEKKGAELFPTETPDNVVMEEYQKIADDVEGEGDLGDLPQGDEAREWLEEFIAFNEDSADQNGYRVW